MCLSLFSVRSQRLLHFLESFYKIHTVFWWEWTDQVLVLVTPHQQQSLAILRRTLDADVADGGKRQMPCLNRPQHSSSPPGISVPVICQRWFHTGRDQLIMLIGHMAYYNDCRPTYMCHQFLSAWSVTSAAVPGMVHGGTGHRLSLLIYSLCTC